ncbi:MAG: ferrous iron transport protein A [Lewinellaceae bacterium]|nr:ferrous iron transport protein A [Lewinellaceae bacterium]
MVAIIAGGKHLSEAKPGMAGVVSHYVDDQAGSKLMSMGVLPGSHVIVVRKAPFGGGWYVKVDNFYLALRKEEAASIVLQ